MKNPFRILLFLLPALLVAQPVDRETLKAQIDTLFASNGVGGITALKLRTGMKSLVDSAYNPIDDGAPTLTIIGAGEPGDDVGNDGDVYQRSDTGGIYTKTDGEWTLQFTLALSSHSHPATGISDSSTIGRTLLTAADAAAVRTAIALGTLATQSGTFSGNSSGTNTGDQLLFGSIIVAGQTTVTPASTAQALTLVGGANVTITTNNTTKEVTIASTGGGGGGGSGDLMANGSVPLTGTLGNTPNVITSGTVLDVTKYNTNEIAANKTYTFSASPTTDRPFYARIKNIAAGSIAVTLTPPGGYSLQGVEKNGTLSSFTMAAGQTNYLTFAPVSSSLIEVYGVAPPLTWIEEVQLTHPHLVDGTGATIVTTPTLMTYGHALFSGTDDEAANYAVYRFAVPFDYDPTVPLQASFIFNLGASSDTGTHRYVVSMCDITDSGASLSPTFINPINLDFAGDPGGAIGDRESITWTTLTDWNADLTAGHTILIKVARDGDDAADSSTVSSTDQNLKLKISHLQ